MSAMATLPMSMASVGYALFALQQSLPLEELQPIEFHINAPGALNGQIQPPAYVPAPTTDGGSAFSGVPASPPVPPAAAPAAPAEAPIFVPKPFDPNSVVLPAASVGAGAAVIDAAPTSDVAKPAEEPAAQPATPEVPNEFADVFVPKKQVVEEVQQGPQQPRAAVQIGLLRELSFLDG